MIGPSELCQLGIRNTEFWPCPLSLSNKICVYGVTVCVPWLVLRQFAWVGARWELEMHELSVLEVSGMLMLRLE